MLLHNAVHLYKALLLNTVFTPPPQTAFPSLSPAPVPPVPHSAAPPLLVLAREGLRSLSPAPARTGAWHCRCVNNVRACALHYLTERRGRAWARIQTSA